MANASATTYHHQRSLVGDLYRRNENFSNTQFCFEHLKKWDIKAPDSEVLAVLNPTHVMKTYTSLGATSPSSVSHIIDTYTAKLGEHRHVLQADQTRVKRAYDASRSLASEAAKVVHNKDDLVKLIQKYRPTSH